MNYNLIGIGEEAHGDIISWYYRYKILNHFIKNNYSNKKIYVFLESIDNFIYKYFNNNNPIQFEFFDNNSFFPYLIPGSNFTKEHLEFTKKFHKLYNKNVIFIGIDIQIVKYFDLKKIKNNINPLLYPLLLKYKNKFLQDPNSGISRNKYNAFIINDLMKNINYYQCFYFAHNGHIALNQLNYNNNGKYFIDGYYLNKFKNINYLSILTDGLLLPNTWNCLSKKKCLKIKTFKHSNIKNLLKLFNNNKKYIILDNNILKNNIYKSSNNMKYECNLVILQK